MSAVQIVRLCKTSYSTITQTDDNKFFIIWLVGCCCGCCCCTYCTANSSLVGFWILHHTCLAMSTLPRQLIIHTVFTRLNATGVYFKLGIVDPAFIWHPKLAWALYSWSNGFSSLIFTDINRSVISAAYYTSKTYFRALFKTPPWRPGVYSNPGV